MNDQTLNKTLQDSLQDALNQNQANVGVIHRDAKDVQLAKVLNTDTGRSTRSMREQMQRIVAGLETDIAEATEVRDRVNKRIDNLGKSLAVARASFAMLLMGGDN